MALVQGRMEFPGADGQTLAARVDVPPHPPRAYALFAHCFSCSKDIKAAGRIAQKLTEAGFGVVRFDFTGLGQSEGDFANTNFTTNVQDLVAAADWMVSAGAPPRLLIGHSLGGAAVVTAAREIASAKAVATLGAPADAEHVIHNFGEQIDEIEARGEAVVRLAGRPFTIKRQFLEDVRGASVRDAAAALGRPLLVLHSPIDDTVGVDNATGLFLAARHPKSFVSLDGADHLLSAREDAEYAAEVIAGWSRRYVFEAVTEDQNGVVVSEARRGGKFENAIMIDGHAIIADEPPSVGGRDAGPDPYELVSAGLGACTSMTLRMYSDQKGWPLEKVSVALFHEKTHADDCAHCEEGRKVDVFERRITVEGPLDDDQRARLLEIADKCPVHRTLEEPVVIRTRLVPVR
ncbi:MAG: bifunctional alpha/beta hydrolase/OsmC family protein [Pseudomonadota bacterium]